MSSNSTNRAYLLQTAGENSGTWGLDPGLNGNFNKVDKNLGGVASVVGVSGVSTALSATQYANGTIRISGALTADTAFTFPAVQGWWTIENLTTGSFVTRISITGNPGQFIAVEQGSAADILLDGTNVKFRNLPPVGTYLDVIDTATPLWITGCLVPPYLLCDGSTFSAVTYPYLNAKLGGTTLPDLRGRSRFYLNGGTGRITTAGSGIDGDTRLSAGGAQTVTLVTANLPAYTPSGTISVPTTSILVRGGFPGGGGFQCATSTPNNTGSDGGMVTIGAQTFTGVAQGGTSTAVNKMAPAQISGVTLIRAA